ncbi:DUF2852 domain-containing protein [Alsobacter sp. SYSU M60028]|uniref:DUF2852 domain-containing protein n=1 Tax=Alsobacter ponti TaxID=2962936 RepID=A0ABT1L6V4_9HYPH|nr:DUF2852 domain-containing protein [Alsobacter ponti]
MNHSNDYPNQTGPAYGHGYGGGRGWRWKPLDIALLVVAFIVFWPLGLVVLAWKIWNDRQPNPQDLEQVLRVGFERLQAGFDSMMASFGAGAAAPAGAPPVTGNEAFDAHIREDWARLEADRRRIEEEVEAFRAFLARERSGGRETYERFRASREGRA